MLDPITALPTLYPLYAAFLTFWRTFNATASLLDSGSRLTLASILLACAAGIDALVTTELPRLIAPQLARLLQLAQVARESAATLRRYALLSQGHVALTLTPDAQAVLANPSTQTNALLLLLHGVRIA